MLFSSELAAFLFFCFSEAGSLFFGAGRAGVLFFMVLFSLELVAFKLYSLCWSWSVAVSLTFCFLKLDLFVSSLFWSWHLFVLVSQASTGLRLRF